MSRNPFCVWSRLVCACLVICFAWAVPDFAAPHFAIAQPDPPLTIYRLDDQATFQQGCFDPCDCKLMDPMTIRGAFVLGPGVIGDVVNFHEVTDIYWRVIGKDGSVIHTITGSGTYRITNYGPPQLHALELDLSIDGAQPQHFFSDFIKVPDDRSLDMVVSINGIFCDDIVIRFDATVVPRQERLLYVLISGSHYQAGCIDDGGCQPGNPRPLIGTFSLVPLVHFPTYAEYAVVRLDFDVRADGSKPAIDIRGNGDYLLIQGGVGPIQAMNLRLSVDGQSLAAFDQELENTDTVFPAIDIETDMHDQVGDDVVLTMRARSIRHEAPAGN